MSGERNRAPGRRQTFDQIGFREDDAELPSSIRAAEGETTPRPSSGFTAQGSSWRAYTASAADEQTEESGNVSIQDRGEADSQMEAQDQSPRLVKRSSLKRAQSDGVKGSRVHPVSDCNMEWSTSPEESVGRVASGASENNSSFVNQDMASLVGKRMKLSLHRVQVAARNSSMVAVGTSRGGSQPPIDAAAHRMIYFRTKKELSDLFALPSVSLWGRRANRVVFILILLGIAELAIETCDGPNMGSSEPGYPYLPSEEQHDIYDGLFTAVFTLEFLGRIIETRNIRAIVRDKYMWIDLIGISPWYILQFLEAAGLEADVEHHVSLLRLLRTVRLGLILRQYEQSKIMYSAVRASLRPLSITLFFLFTLVMIIATAIFYAEPCYNVETCTFTDIFNSAYFVMVTVATVGYGNQVPNLKNPGSLMLTMLVMILGQIYFSMPVAIIGNNFHLTYENFQLGRKKKARYLDASLSPFDCQILHSHAKRLCDIQYHLLNAWSVVHCHISGIARTNTRTSQSTTMNLDILETEADRQVKIKEIISRLLELHSEAVLLLQIFIPHQRRSLQIQSDFQSQGVLSHMYSKAKQAMAKTKLQSGQLPAVIDQRSLSQTFRGRLWLLIEVPDSSRLATILNQAMVGFALISVMLFFTESLQELAASGVDTNACRAVVKSYCSSSGFKSMDPACFLRYDNGTSDFNEHLHFFCSTAIESPECYGNGLNFGSLNSSALACKDAFLEKGVDYVCFRQQCRISFNMLFDMGPYWIYFEWYFGIVFTMEFVFRFYISQNRKHFWRNVYVVFDLLAIIPFFVEVVELLYARIEPDYAIVATSPSFLSVIRLLKIMRILKLTRHFRGTKVLASTAIKVWKPLVIPLFFLFTGCIVAGAVFYEIERGRECFVGEPCWWWQKDVLTPELAAGLPIGKRILIQDKTEATITDMIHSTWLSYTTLTSVGYGDLVPRTAIGKFFDIFVIIVATIYSAMPLSLVGTQFYSLYEKHMERMVVKQGGSSLSWRTKSTITVLMQTKKTTQPPPTRKAELFALSEDHLIIAHEFESMRITIQNLRRTLETAITTSFNGQRKPSIPAKNVKTTVASRRSMVTNIDQSIELKSAAIMDTLLQFSQVVERLQEAPMDFEAFEGMEDDLDTNICPTGFSSRPASDPDTLF